MLLFHGLFERPTDADAGSSSESLELYYDEYEPSISSRTQEQEQEQEQGEDQQDNLDALAKDFAQAGQLFAGTVEPAANEYQLPALVCPGTTSSSRSNIPEDILATPPLRIASLIQSAAAGPQRIAKQRRSTIHALTSTAFWSCPRPYCDSEPLTLNVETIRRHFNTHLRNQRWACLGCPKTFSRPDAVARHCRFKGNEGCKKALENEGYSFSTKEKINKLNVGHALLRDWKRKNPGATHWSEEADADIETEITNVKARLAELKQQQGEQ